MFKIWSILLFVTIIFLMLSVTVFAASISVSPKTINYGDNVTITIGDIEKLNAGYNLSVKLSVANTIGGTTATNIQIITSTNGTCTVRITDNGGTWTSSSCSGSDSFSFSGTINSSKIGADPNSTNDVEYSVLLGATAIDGNSILLKETFIIKASKPSAATFTLTSQKPDPVKPGEDVEIILSGTNSGKYSYILAGASGGEFNCAGAPCSFTFKVPDEVTNSSVNLGIADFNGILKTFILRVDPPTPLPSSATLKPTITICTEADQKAGKCSNAVGIVCGDEKNPGVVTAIGCIHTQPIEFIKDFLKLTMGIAGGIGFLFMLYGAFLILSSAGNPDTLKNGSGVFTNAIIGLLFIIFSLLLLKIIGVDILGLGKQFGI